MGPDVENERTTKPDSAASVLTAGLCLCDNGVRIVYEHGRPSGIRDSGGYLFFFSDIMKYEGQDERYRQEREQQQALAEFLLAALKRHNG
jgi:hypothetical protein